MRRIEAFAFRALRSGRLWTVLSAAVILLQFRPWWDPGPDASSYLSIARSIARGEGPANLSSPRLFYAPGYPLAISPAFLLGERPFAATSILHIAFALIFHAGLLKWLRRFSPRAAPFLAFLTISNVSFLLAVTYTQSELLFMTLLVWAGLAFDRLLDVRKAESPPPLLFVCGGLLAFYLALTRQAGIFLAAGVAAAALLRFRKGRIPLARAAGTALLAGVPSLAAVAGTIAYEEAAARKAGGRTYADYFLEKPKTFAERVGEPTRWTISAAGRLVVPGMFKAYGRRWLNVNTAVHLAAFLLIAWGWLLLVRRRPDPLCWTVPFYTAFFCQWPFDQGTRFLLPLLPVFVLSLWTLGRRLRRCRSTVFLLLAAGHLGVAAGYIATRLPEVRAANESWEAVERLAEAIRTGPRTVPPPAIFWNGPKDDLGLMLQFAADLPVLFRGKDPARSPHAGRPLLWRVEPADAPVPEGYELVLRSERFLLLRRADMR